MGQLVNSKVSAWVVNKLSPLKNNQSLLDVGTGYGYFLKHVKNKYSLSVTGLEPAEEQVNHACSQLSLNVQQANLKESTLPKEGFDLVTAFEVIEHVSCPVTFLKEMKEYLKVGGRMVILTDNFDSTNARSLGMSFPKWIPHSHVSHFTPSSLGNAIDKTQGLEVISSGSYTPWEIKLMNIRHKIFNSRKSEVVSFSVAEALEKESNGNYKYFSLRKMINHIWVRISFSKQMDGDLMYFVAQKTN